MKQLVLMMMMACAMMACGSSTKNNETGAQPKKALVLYYSVTNTTEQLAKYIAQQTGADLVEIKPVDAYPTDYQQLIARSGKEIADNVLPELQPLGVDVDDYDIVFVGYPIWMGTYAQPVKTLIGSGVLSGKVVVPFCTSGSSGIKQSVEDLRRAVPDAQIAASVGVRSSLMSKMPAAVDRVLIDLGLIEGENEPLADYSAQRAPTAEEEAIFNAAISTYPMMNGTRAVSVGSRTTSAGTDYKFVGEAAGRDGATSRMDIYVTRENNGSEPYFTAVDR